MISGHHRTRAILLRAVDYRDNDRILTLLTDKFGKVSALARGARSSKRRFAGALEPFSVFDAELTFGRSELATLNGAALAQSWPAIYTNLAKMGVLGAALASLRDVLPDREIEHHVFDMVQRFFDAVAHSQAPVSAWTLVFQAKLLGLLGCAPHVHSCVGCRRTPGDEQRALFDPVSDGIRCVACGGGPLSLSAGGRSLLLAVAASAPGSWELLNQSFQEGELRDASRVVHSVMVNRLNRKSVPPQSMQTWNLSNEQLNANPH